MDVIHTDGNHLGTMVPLGHADFYVADDADWFGSEQSDCTLFTCDHSRSWILVRASLTNQDSCWATVRCTGPGTGDTRYTLIGCAEITERPHFGYFYDGNLQGNFGVLLTLEEDPWCFRCVDDNECGVGDICDLTSSPEHSCVPSEKRTPTTTTSSESSTTIAPSGESNTCSSE